jgi:hypothetical protein
VSADHPVAGKENAAKNVGTGSPAASDSEGVEGTVHGSTNELALGTSAESLVVY